MYEIPIDVAAAPCQRFANNVMLMSRGTRLRDRPCRGATYLVWIRCLDGEQHRYLPAEASRHSYNIGCCMYVADQAGHSFLSEQHFFAKSSRKTAHAAREEVGVGATNVSVSQLSLLAAASSKLPSGRFLRFSRESCVVCASGVNNLLKKKGVLFC